MGYNNEELVNEFKFRLENEKSLKNKVNLKKIIELINSLD